jgi:hypothetical protein
MVKWIALSAETIWSALDKADYLGATLAYLQTERVYKAFVADKTNQKLDPRTRELAVRNIITLLRTTSLNAFFPELHGDRGWAMGAYLQVI